MAKIINKRQSAKILIKMKYSINQILKILRFMIYKLVLENLSIENMEICSFKMINFIPSKSF